MLSTAMPAPKRSTVPILVEPPSVIELYLRLASLTMMISVCVVIVAVTGALLKDHLLNLYRKWLYYLE
jgi:hypothetical protein